MKTNIAIPQELKGQKAIPFIEKYRYYKDLYLNDTLNLISFTELISQYYKFVSQKFDVGMLVNNFRKNKNDKLYLEAESLRIFEGWEYIGTNEMNVITLAYQGIRYNFYKDLVDNQHDDDVIINIHKDYTLNDFISDWNKYSKTMIEEIELIFKK